MRRYYHNVITSIAFYPAIIALAFLIVSYLVLTLDFSDYGKQLKSQLDFLSLKDASTARTIAATIAGGILSLTVFSFSMVMILLNEAATNMSNRVLGSMIGNRFQQYVLGFYIGTIVYALFLLSTIRDIDSGIYVPALSVYLLILLTIVDIFLFIYFIHFITQSVKFETIIDRIHHQTKIQLKEKSTCQENHQETLPTFESGHELRTKEAGYFQGFNHEELLEMCVEQNYKIAFLFPVGSYILAQTPFLTIKADRALTEKEQEDVRILVDFYRGESVKDNPFYGFKQLVEVALKALSPGVNDPGTAVLSLHVLVDLLSFQLNNLAVNAIKDEEDQVRIVFKEISFQEVFERTLLPIWDYGQNDRILRTEMKNILEQLHHFPGRAEDKALISEMFYMVSEKVKKEL